MKKDDIKIGLIITFVVVELLSMLFNFSFAKFAVGDYYATFNYSVVFFCIGFYIVDLVSDFFSPQEANKFFYYKIYSQVIFILFSYSAIYAYGLENTQIAEMIGDSPLVIGGGFVATYIGFQTTTRIMTKMKRGIYQGGSIFRRYLYSTLPGEIIFSLVFSSISFSYGRSFSDLMQIFISSCIAKFILSTIFALVISFLYKFMIFHKHLPHYDTNDLEKHHRQISNEMEVL